jgi:Ankyrin repeats (3 copies)
MSSLMRSISIILLSFAFLSNSMPAIAQRVEASTLERVSLFPDQYEGQVLFIDGVTIREVGRCDEAFCLTATSPEGKLFTPVLKRDGIALTVSSKMADLLLAAKNRIGFSAIDWDKEPVRIGFRVFKLQTRYGGYWVTQVFEVAITSVMHTSVITTSEKDSVLYAAARGDSQTIKFLVKSKDLANAGDENGKSALMYAAEGKHEKTVKTLLALDADVAAKTNDGKTALNFAQASGNSAIVKMLSKASERR